MLHAAPALCTYTQPRQPRASTRPQVRSGLLAWYDANHRILPWRRNPRSRLPAEAVAAAAAKGFHPAPADLPQNEFIYYVW